MSLYDIEKIKIMIKTNIPDKEPIPFDSKMLYIQNKTGYSDYPYITKQVRYPYSQLAKMEYSDIAYFFFNKNAFIQQLSSEIKKVKINLSETPEKKKKREDDNIEYNIITMLELLFPTYFPTYNNFYISFVSNMGGQIEIPQKSLFGRNKRFSYINIDKPYTISKITWLNDVINHPVYGDFIDDFYNYKKWSEYIIPEIENKVKTAQSDIDLLILNIDVNNEIRELEKYYTNLDNRRGYHDSSITQSKFNISNMIKILRVIDIYKIYFKDEIEFIKAYAKIINDLIDPAKNNWVEYNAINDGYWYPVQILKHNTVDNTYDIYIYKYKNGNYNAEVERYVLASRLRPFDIKPETDTDNYEFAHYSDILYSTEQKLNDIFIDPSPNPSLEKKISITSVNTDYGTADIKINGIPYENVHFIYLRSLRKSSIDNTKYTKEPQQYLSESLYKLKEIYSNLKYTNFSLNFKNFIKKILEINDKIIQYSTFKNSYLDKDYLKFDINFKVDEEFEQFTEMSKSVQKISSSSTKTTNNILQLLIDDYANNSKKYEVERSSGTKYKTHLFYELLNYIINCYWLNGVSCEQTTIKNAYDKVDALNKENIKNFKDFIEDKTLFKTLFKTNINRINLKGGKNLPHYEIYIAADLLGDKIDETNVNKIKCAYNDYNATNILKNGVINIKRNPYIVEQGPLIELPKNPQNDLDKKPPIKIGGRTKRKRNKNYKKISKRYTRRII